jgi:hypothetical protein
MSDKPIFEHNVMSPQHPRWKEFVEKVVDKGRGEHTTRYAHKILAEMGGLDTDLSKFRRCGACDCTFLIPAMLAGRWLHDDYDRFVMTDEQAQRDVAVNILWRVVLRQSEEVRARRVAVGLNSRTDDDDEQTIREQLDLLPTKLLTTLAHAYPGSCY